MNRRHYTHSSEDINRGLMYSNPSNSDWSMVSSIFLPWREKTWISDARELLQLTTAFDSIWRGVSIKKTMVTLDLMSNSPFLIEGSGKQFARRIFQSIRCHLRYFSTHPFLWPREGGTTGRKRGTARGRDSWKGVGWREGRDRGWPEPDRKKKLKSCYNLRVIRSKLNRLVCKLRIKVFQSVLVFNPWLEWGRNLSCFQLLTEKNKTKWCCTLKNGSNITPKFLSVTQSRTCQVEGFNIELSQQSSWAESKSPENMPIRVSEVKVHKYAKLCIVLKLD